jgi:hypothetical protein
MRNEIISIIAEGAEDVGVIKSILLAFGYDGSEIIPIRPGLSKDATDKYKDSQTIGTFQGVKNSCIGNNGKRLDFDRAFSLYDSTYMVIQLDTAEIEAQDFKFIKPLKQNNDNYCLELRNSVIFIIDEWLEQNYKDKIFYAISIEELEAWCLTIFENKDTAKMVNVKGKWDVHLNRNNLTYRDLKCDPIKGKTQYFENITKKYKFNKLEKLKEFSKNNHSLKYFIQSLEEKLLCN